MYQLTSGANIVHVASGREFPPALDNLDYLAYQSWLELGNTPAAYTPPPAPVPSVVTRRQARRALLEAGLLASVNAAIAVMPSPAKERAQIDWDDATTFERDNPLVGQLAGALDLDATALDSLFMAAAAL